MPGFIGAGKQAPRPHPRSWFGFDWYTHTGFVLDERHPIREHPATLSALDRLFYLFAPGRCHRSSPGTVDGKHHVILRPGDGALGCLENAVRRLFFRIEPQQPLELCELHEDLTVGNKDRDDLDVEVRGKVPEYRELEPL